MMMMMVMTNKRSSYLVQDTIEEFEEFCNKKVVILISFAVMIMPIKTVVLMIMVVVMMVTMMTMTMMIIPQTMKKLQAFSSIIAIQPTHRSTREIC